MLNVGTETLQGAGRGAAAGAGMGAMIGTSIFPGIGTATGTIAGAIIGLIGGGITGNKQSKAMNTALERVEGISETDPMQLEFLDDLRREKRMVETGMTPEFNVAKDLIQQSAAGAMSMATRFNNPATSLYFLNTISRGAGQNINQLMGTIGSQRGNYMQALGSYINDISQRKLDVEMYKTTQDLAIATQDKADTKANQNMMMMLGLSELSGAGEDDKGGLFLDLIKWWNNRSIPTQSLASKPASLISNPATAGIGTTLRPM